MGIGRAMLLCAVVTVVCAAAWTRLARWTALEVGTLEVQHRADLRQRREDIESAAHAAREQEFKLREERERQRQEEWTRALGDPVDAVLKNPILNLAGFLKELAILSMPRGSTVQVKVERFTEYRITVELASPSTSAELCEACRTLLAHGRPYIHLLRVLHEEKTVVELDRVGVESLPDWRMASVDAVTAALTRIDPGLSELPAAGDLGAQTPFPDPEEEEPVPEGEEGRVIRSDRTFFKRFEIARNALLAASEASQGLLSPETARGRSGIQDRLQLLDRGLQVVDRYYTLMVKPEQEYERVLNAQGVDPVYVRAWLRGVPELYGAAQEADRLVVAVRDQLQQARKLLQVLDANRGGWELKPRTLEIQVLDPVFEPVLSKAMEAESKATQAARLAWEAWSRAAWKKQPSAKGG